jgi:hypothetical protein
MTWTELRVHAPRERQAAILTEGIGQFLQACRRGHFVPDPERDTISTFLDGADDPDLGRTLLAFLQERGLPVARVEVVPGARPTLHEVQMKGPAAQDLVDDFLVDSSPLALALVAASSRTEDRLSIAFDLMVAQTLVLKGLLFEALRPLPCPLAFVSYRSHVDGFFVMSKDPPATRAAFEDRFTRVAPRLRARLGALVEQLAGGALVSAPARAWVALLERAVARVQDGLRAGSLLVNLEGGDGYMGDNFDLSVSPFHQVIQDDPALRAFAARDVDFNTMRIAAALLYLTLHRFGVRLVDRYLLCHFAARSFETVHEIEPAQAIRQFSRVLAHGRGAA